jgi:hypothetical protein
MKKLLIIFAFLLFAVPSFAKVELALKPQVGLSYTNDFRFAAGLNFLESGKFNSSFMVTAKEWEYGIAVTRTLSDVLPVSSLQIGVYGVNFFGNFKVGGIVCVKL